VDLALENNVYIVSGSQYWFFVLCGGTTVRQFLKFPYFITLHFGNFILIEKHFIIVRVGVELIEHWMIFRSEVLRDGLDDEVVANRAVLTSVSGEQSISPSRISLTYQLHFAFRIVIQENRSHVFLVVITRSHI